MSFDPDDPHDVTNLPERPLRNLRVGFVSLGCPKNLVDSEVMIGLAQQAGHTLTADATNADVLVVNTCAFIDSAKQESIDAILEAASKKNGGVQRLVVTGCLAQRYGEELRREIPEIDVVLGTDQVPEIVQAISGSVGHASGKAKASPCDTAAVPMRLLRKPRTPTYIYDANTPRVRTTPRHYAYVKVAEGCDYSCAFCIIPTLRGAYRSRPADSIVAEANHLASQGVRELLLISQDTSFYGVDRGERGALASLLGRLNDVDGLEWIRLLYLYPTTVDDRILDAMAECSKVCRYVDLPLQHASAAVLRRMGRPGTGDSYRRLLSRIRERVPGVALRTTFIVGFPGETEAEFEELRQFVAEIGFDHVGVFTYSHEEGTRAFDLADDVPAEVKEARREAIMELQRSLVFARSRARVGERVRVMVEGPSAEHELVIKGRLEAQAPDIDSVVYFSECDVAAVPPGTLVDAEIVAAEDYDLVVRTVDEEP